MPRSLNVALDALMVNATRREPAAQVFVYDLRSTEKDPNSTRIGDVVLSNVGEPPATVPAIVGPRDFAGDVLSMRITEAGGDLVDGIASSTLELSIADPSGELDPIRNPAPGDGRWLRQGNAVVVREGDAQVDPSLWPITFTGILVGQAGGNRNRTTGRSELTVVAAGREQQFFDHAQTSVNFPQGTPFSDVVEAIAQEMDLDPQELDFPTNFATTLTCHLSTQVVEQIPLVAIAEILFADGQLPKFGGDGRLRIVDADVAKAPARVYANDELITELDRPRVVDSGPNSVVVKGLSCDMTEVVQPRQVLARASITTGFFSQDAEIPVQWSGDGTLQAKNTRLEVRASIADGPFGFGSESYLEDTQADGNAITGTISVEGGLALWLVGAIFGAWLLSHSIPDGVEAGSVTIPIGSLAQAAAGQVLFQAVSTVGRGQYEVTGQPIEYVYEELRGIADVKGVRSSDVREITIENALIGTQADVDAAAMRVLRRERKKVNARSFRMIPDLRLEPNDVFETTDGRRYAIGQIARTLVSGTYEANLDCFEVTAGVRA